MRIGQGYDVHAFGPGQHITLGGVSIPHHRGIIAHSDGDVVIHALCDALLGALALGDIGHHFPPTDVRWKGADSQIFLRHTYEMVTQHGYRLGNADITVLAEVPRLAPYIADMRVALAACMQCDQEKISIKATTTEKLGFIGREEGIAAMATVLLLND